MSNGATVISGISPLFERPLFNYAAEFYQTNDIELILKPGIDIALAGSEFADIKPETLFALHEQVQTRAARSIGSRPRNCMIITNRRSRAPNRNLTYMRR